MYQLPTYADILRQYAPTSAYCSCFEFQFPVHPLLIGFFFAVLALFVIIWLWKLVVSLVTGA